MKCTQSGMDSSGVDFYVCGKNTCRNHPEWLSYKQRPWPRNATSCSDWHILPPSPRGAHVHFPGFSGDFSAYARREWAIMKALKGVGVPRIYWTGMATKFHVMVMDRLGESLQVFISYIKSCTLAFHCIYVAINQCVLFTTRACHSTVELRTISNPSVLYCSCCLWLQSILDSRAAHRLSLPELRVTALKCFDLLRGLHQAGCVPRLHLAFPPFCSLPHSRRLARLHPPLSLP